MTIYDVSYSFHTVKTPFFALNLTIGVKDNHFGGKKWPFSGLGRCPGPISI